MQNNRIVSLVFLGLVAGVFGCNGHGCQRAQSQAYNVVVDADQQLANTTTRVHLVAVSDSQLPTWEAKSMTEYWNPEDGLRSSAMASGTVYEMDFGGRAMREVLPKDSPQWSTWMRNQATWLLVLADIPGDHVDKDGAADQRRVVLPLDRRRWDRGTDTLRIQLYEGIVTAKTIPKAETTK